MRIVIISTIFFSITVFSLFAGLAVAEETVCPQTDYALERDGLHGCQYTDDISVEVTIWGHCSHYLSNIYQEDVQVMKKRKALWLYSPTHPVMVYVNLNKKEFKKKRRDYWIAKGREFLREVEKTALNCTDPDSSAPQQDNSFIQTRPPSETPVQELVPEKKTPPPPEISAQEVVPEKEPQAPAAWDDFDAPSPKAKSRE